MLVVIIFEASSELVTHAEQRKSYKYGNSRTLDQLNCSAAAADKFYYSPEITKLNLQCCSRPDARSGGTVISKANIIVVSGMFDPSHNSYPKINRTVLCRHDSEISGTEAILIHTPIATQKASFQDGETFVEGDILHRIYEVGFVREFHREGSHKEV